MRIVTIQMPTVQMPTCFQRPYRLFISGISTIALMSAIAPNAAISAELVNVGISHLTSAYPTPEHSTPEHSTPEQLAAQDGVTVTGENGQYTGQVTANGAIDTAWNVLTDYNNFKNFFPGVTESKLLETHGNQKVFEQVNVYRVLLFTRRSRVVIAATESYPRQIAFSVVQGDVRSLQGTWQLQAIAPHQVRVTYQVAVEPKSSSTRSLFFSIYKNSLENTLAAIKQEIERRSAAG